jgi:phosphomannomutase/phosphoglucomutase
MTGIYRAYDIRGVYGKDLTDEVAGKIGRAFATKTGGGTIAVGRDVRLSGDALNKALVKGLTSSGADVIDIGVVPTPVLYFAVHTLKTDGGIMITGSHNPPEYNGLKLMRGLDTLYGPQIAEIDEIVATGKYKNGSGKTSKKNLIPDYINHIAKNIKIKKKLKVVVDAGNGAAGLVAPQLYRKMGLKVVELYCEPDGRFPNHDADPTVDENIGDLIAAVEKEGADLGIGFDGDGDRAGFISEKGEIIRGDQALVLFSREILSRKPGSKIIFEVKCSQALPEDIKAHGGVPIMYRTGHSFIKKKIKEENAAAAGEMSGHFFFADRYLGYDDAVYAGARMIEILSHGSESLSSLLASIPKYYSTPEIRVDCPDDKKFQVIEKTTQAFKKQGLNVVTIDGARVSWPDGWGLVRASNTTPKLILRFEAKTQKRLKEIRKIIEDKSKNN